MERKSEPCEVHYSAGAYEDALRYVKEGVKEAQATASQKYAARGWSLRGKILAHQGNIEAAGAELQRAFSRAEQLHSPSLVYPIAFDLGQWYETAGKERKALELYGKAKATVENMAIAVEDQSLRSVFMQSAPVQTIYESLARTR